MIDRERWIKKFLERFNLDPKNDVLYELVEAYAYDLEARDLDLPPLRSCTLSDIPDLRDYLETSQVQPEIDLETVHYVKLQDGKWWQCPQEEGIPVTPVPRGTWDGQLFANPREGLEPEEEGFFFMPDQVNLPIQQPWLSNIKTHFFYWYDEFINILSNFTDGPAVMGQCHKEWSTFVNDPTLKRLIMLCARDHFKTQFIGIGYALYLICEHPDLCNKGICFSSWSENNCVASFDSIMENLTKNKKILAMYGKLIDENRKFTQQVLYFKFQGMAGKPGLMCATFESGKITGTHPYLLILDDVQEKELSEAYMRHARDIIIRRAIPAVGTTGRIIVIGTVKGFNKKNDVYLYLQEKPGWVLRKYPAVLEMPPPDAIHYTRTIQTRLDPLGQPVKDIYNQPIMDVLFSITVDNPELYKMLYPERYTIVDIVRKKLEMSEDDKEGEAAFWQEFQLMAFKASGNHFNMERVFSFPNEEFINDDALKEFIRKENLILKAWLDYGGKKSHGIAMVLLTHYLNRQTLQYKIIVIDCYVCKGGPTEAGRKLADWKRQWGLNLWGGEFNFAQNELYGVQVARALLENLSETCQESLYSGDQGADNEGQKEVRIDSRMKLMLGQPGDPPMLYVRQTATHYENIMAEMRSFPEPPDKKNEFDLIDALTSCDIHYRNYCPELFVIGDQYPEISNY